MKTKDLISIKDLSRDYIEKILSLTEKIKGREKGYRKYLEGKTLALIFQKPSNRTRVSFEVGIYQLGGHSIYLGPDDIGLGRREKTKDVAGVLSRYVDGIVARTFSHEDVCELAKHATIPVINGLSDLLHPCQVLSDLYTIKEKLGRLNGVKVAFIGDGNNVLHSLLHGCSKTGVSLNIATPKKYEPNEEILRESQTFSAESGAAISLSNNPSEAVKGSDIIYTDVWVSMGEENKRDEKLKAFSGFQVNSDLVSKAKKDCLIMHCLPAHKGEEITDDVIDGPKSIVLDQAENRLHLHKTILLLLLGKK